MARTNAKRWLKLVAGLAIGVSIPMLDVWAAGETAPPVPPPTASSGSRLGAARAALNDGLASHRRGDYDTAAVQFKIAGERQGDLTSTEQYELTRLTQDNARAQQARRLGAEQLRQVEKALSAGGRAEATNALRLALPNEQYLSEADKQKLSKLMRELRPTGPAPSPLPSGVIPVQGSQAVNTPAAMLKQARVEMAAGNFDEAEKLVRAAERSRATFAPTEDNPARVLADLNKTYADGKGLLAASRVALQAKDYARAERFAKAAEKSGSSWSSALWGDSPAKVLREVRAAKEREPVLSKRPITAASNAPGGDDARKLLTDARKALTAGDLARAQTLNDQVRLKKVDFSFWEDSPEKLQGDISRAVARTKGPGGLTPLDGKPETVKKPARIEPVKKPVTKEDGVTLLRQARVWLQEQKLDEATQAAQKVQGMANVTWGLFDDTPDKLLRDIAKARAQFDRENSTKVMAEARRLYKAGDFDGASRAAYRAEKLHGAYSLWDLGDRPSKLLAEIQTARDSGRTPNAPQLAATDKDKPATGVTTAALTERVDKSKPMGTQVVRTDARVPVPMSPNGTPNLGAGLAIPVPPPGTIPGSANAEGKKAQAQQLLIAARKLQTEGRLIEARQQAVEAQRLGIVFGPTDDSPEQAILQMASAARQRVDVLTSGAVEEARYGKGDPATRFASAERMLKQARELAAGFGQDVQPIDAKLTWVRQQTSVAQVAPMQPSASVPMPVPFPTQPAQPAAIGTASLGKELLEKARLELRRGDLNTARKLAQDAYNGKHDVQEEAVAVLRTIDAEEFGQRSLQASRAFDAAQAAYNRREYQNALTLFQSLDAKQLDPKRQNRLKELLMTPEMQPSVATTSAKTLPTTTKPGLAPAVLPGKALAADTGRASATDAAPAPEKGLINQVEAMRQVAFDKLRQDGLKAQRDASEKFRTGQTDAALEILQEHLAQVADAQLEPSQNNLLKRPVESRLQQFKLLKAQRDFIERDGQATASQKGAVKSKELAEANKQKKVADLMKKFNTLYKEGKYLEAESYAMLAHELDPDNSMAAAAINIAKNQRNQTAAKDLKRKKADFNLAALNDAEDPGQAGAITQGVSFNKEVFDKAKNRKSIQLVSVRKSEKDKEIESRLSAPVNLNFQDTPLNQVIEDLRSWQGINIYIDAPALEAEGVSLDRKVSIKLEQVSLKSALNLLLHNVHLTYIIKDEVLQITTESQAKGKNQTVTYQVVDLVIPIENFGTVQNGQQSPLLTMMNSKKQPTTQPSPYGGPLTLPNGQPTGQPNNSGSQYPSSPFSPSTNDSGGSWSKKSDSKTLEDSLIKLITNTVEPRSWAEMGGPGTIDYHPLTMSLVINQTPDIQEQVADLLAALRRLQDQEVAIEVRLISIADDFFERIGVDFDLNIKTDKHTARYEPQIVTGAFKPEGFINDPNFKHFFAGIQPGGTFTSDLDIPINSQTFGQALPPFGGYNGIPGFGGITLGLGFLSDIQVFLFMEAVQGDVRTNVMQAPKLTMFNGQTATLNVSDNQYFVTNVTVGNQFGQFTFSPDVTAIPTQVSMTLQPVISADRRFVRVSPFLQIVNLTSAVVPLFPVVVPIFPQFDGTATGNPVVFTQYIQQPTFTSVNVQTTVNVPDGGTVVMGGLKRLSEGRNEYGPPILSKIPYINRLFKNVGYGREAHSLLIMVTPRIIIMEEEEVRMTGVSRDAPSVVP